MRFSLVKKLAQRDLKSGEVGLLLISLVVAVGTVTSISLFVDRLHQALIEESANFLAADRQISSSREIPEDFVYKAGELGLDTSQTMVFSSMVFSEDRNQLVSVKAVDANYPLRGELIVTDEPFVRGYPTKSIPLPGEIWLDSRLFPALAVELGDQIEVGLALLRVTNVLVAEPDKGGSFFDLGPRVLMNMADVPATDVVQPGSRLSYRLLLAGDDEKLSALRSDLDLEPNYRWVSISESSPRIGSALDRAESFLLLGGLLAVLLAGVAVSLSAHRYAARHFDHVAILKTLGATPRQIFWGYLSILLLVGSFAILMGLLVGGALHLLVIELLASLIPVDLPNPGVRPFFLGAATGFICALSFAVPSFLHLRDISPMRVIRRDLGVPTMSRMISYGAAAMGSIFLMVWYTKSLFLTAWTLTGLISVTLVFGSIALFLLKGGRAVGMQARSGIKLALSGLQRRRLENTAQILIFGLAIMLLLILLLLRTALISEWRSQVPENAANHFVMNISSEEVDDIRALVDKNVTMGDALYPMIRGRLSAVDDVPAKEWQKSIRTHEYEGGPRITSERNLTWAADKPENNAIVSGEWWGQSAKKNQVSIEKEYAEDFNLKLGTKLTFNIGGKIVSAEVTSIRTLEWESMSPNFYIIFSPGVLKDFPATYMTSFYLEKNQKVFLNELLSEHPTITVIEIDALIEQVQKIVDQVSQAVELVLGLVLASGCLVLIASIQSSRDSRLAEHALVRALGGTRRLIGSSLLAEFVILGFFSGFVASVGAEITVALLQSQVFELGAEIHWWIWPVGPVIGAIVISIVGMLGSRELVNSPPMSVLRGVS